MKTRFPLLSVTAVLVAAVFLCSCEDHDQKVYVNSSASSGAAASSGGGASVGAASSSVSGTWSGRSATSQISSKLYLSETNGKISGSLAWPGDTRSVSGTRSGASVTLHIGGGDTWKLSFSGNRLSGTGYKYGGGTYSCSFAR